MVMINGKEVDLRSVEMDVNKSDYPDFCDSFATTAWFEDGTELTDAEMDELNDMSDVIYELCVDRVF